MSPTDNRLDPIGRPAFPGEPGPAAAALAWLAEREARQAIPPPVQTTGDVADVIAEPLIGSGCKVRSRNPEFLVITLERGETITVELDRLDGRPAPPSAPRGTAADLDDLDRFAEAFERLRPVPVAVDGSGPAETRSDRLEPETLRKVADVLAAFDRSR